jgi:hypothetical protein
MWVSTRESKHEEIQHSRRTHDADAPRSPWQKATGCEDTERSLRKRTQSSGNSPRFSVVSDTGDEFSVFSQAVQNFTTAC